MNFLYSGYFAIKYLLNHDVKANETKNIIQCGAMLGDDDGFPFLTPFDTFDNITTIFNYLIIRFTLFSLECMSKVI